MAQSARASDADVIMRLYELRREEKMRTARNWFLTKFKGIQSTEELAKIAPPGSDENAYFRMVISYWDMAAGFVNSGAVNADLFFRSGNEMLFVWIRVSEVVPEMRRTRDNPLMYGDLEQASATMTKWMSDRAPGSYDAFRKMVLS